MASIRTHTWTTNCTIAAPGRRPAGHEDVAGVQADLGRALRPSLYVHVSRRSPRVHPAADISVRSQAVGVSTTRAAASTTAAREAEPEEIEVDVEQELQRHARGREDRQGSREPLRGCRRSRADPRSSAAQGEIGDQRQRREHGEHAEPAVGCAGALGLEVVSSSEPSPMLTSNHGRKMRSRTSRMATPARISSPRVNWRPPWPDIFGDHQCRCQEPRRPASSPPIGPSATSRRRPSRRARPARDGGGRGSWSRSTTPARCTGICGSNATACSRRGRSRRASPSTRNATTSPFRPRTIRSSTSTFQGDIPAGEYGGGAMGVWDHGTFETHKWDEREVMVTFHGERVHGRYVLFRTRGQAVDDPPHGSAEDPASRAEPERLGRCWRRWRHSRRRGEGWACELKWDGIRAIGYVDGGRLRLVSRNGNDVTRRYPELRRLGRSARHARRRCSTARSSRSTRPAGRASSGCSAACTSGATRRSAGCRAACRSTVCDLRPALPRRPLADDLPYARATRDGSRSLELSGPAWRVPARPRRRRQAAARGDPASRGSRASSPSGSTRRYEPGRRTGRWLKIKNTLRQELVIGGWLPGEGRRTSRIGALLVGLLRGRRAALRRPRRHRLHREEA